MFEVYTWYHKKSGKKEIEEVFELWWTGGCWPPTQRTGSEGNKQDLENWKNRPHATEVLSSLCALSPSPLPSLFHSVSLQAQKEISQRQGTSSVL